MPGDVGGWRYSRDRPLGAGLACPPAANRDAGEAHVADELEQADAEMVARRIVMRRAVWDQLVTLAEAYRYAYDRGLKGCTTFRPNPVTGAILSTAGEGFDKGSHCCDLEREAD